MQPVGVAYSARLCQSANGDGLSHLYAMKYIPTKSVCLFVVCIVLYLYHKHCL